MSWRVARSLLTLREQINARYPDRSRVSDGTIGDEDHQNRASDHNPWYGPGIVTALDITHDPKAGVDIDRLTDELAASRDPRIKYIIANRLILDTRPGFNPWTWQPYHGSNPHTRHFHLSVVADPRCDDPRPWDLPSLTGGGGGAAVGGGEDDMPYSEQDLTLYAYRGTVTAWQDAAYHPESHSARAVRAAITPILAPVRGEVAGLGEAVRQLASGHDIDLGAIREAARQGAQQGTAEGLAEGLADGAIEGHLDVRFERGEQG